MIEFLADRVHVSGPSKTDGTYTVKFDLGEYQQEQAVKLMAIRRDLILKVTVEVGE